MEMIMMMDPAVKCLCLLAVVAVLFVTEKLPLAVTSVFAAIFCWLLGLVPIEQVFLGLADSTVVLFGGMFIVGAAMFYTGLAQDIGGQIVKLFGTGEIKLMVGIMVIAAVMSAFLSNTGTTACLIPVVIGICKEAHIPFNSVSLNMPGSVYRLPWQAFSTWYSSDATCCLRQTPMILMWMKWNRKSKPMKHLKQRKSSAV